MIYLVRLFSFVFTLQVAFAGIAFTPHPGYAAPLYFSGTNARASFQCEVTYPSLHLEAAELLINGEVLISETYPILGPPHRPFYLYSMTLPVMFDSKHFSTGTPVTVKMRG